MGERFRSKQRCFLERNSRAARHLLGLANRANQSLPVCTLKDWTISRFSAQIVDATRQTIKKIAEERPVVLIGYSGGALLTGLVIQTTPELKVKKWITVAGVLNHASRTGYFDDQPLTDSLDLETLPDIEQIHFAGEKDKLVPLELAKTWSDVSVVPKAPTTPDGKNQV